MKVLLINAETDEAIECFEMHTTPRVGESISLRHGDEADAMIVIDVEHRLDLDSPNVSYVPAVTVALADDAPTDEDPGQLPSVWPTEEAESGLAQPLPNKEN